MYHASSSRTTTKRGTIQLLLGDWQAAVLSVPEAIVSTDTLSSRSPSLPHVLSWWTWRCKGHSVPVPQPAQPKSDATGCGSARFQAGAELRDRVRSIALAGVQPGRRRDLPAEPGRMSVALICSCCSGTAISGEKQQLFAQFCPCVQTGWCLEGTDPPL